MKFIISNIVVISIFTTIVIHFLFFLKERISTNNKIKDVHERINITNKEIKNINNEIENVYKKIRDIRHDYKNTQVLLQSICHKLQIFKKEQDIDDMQNNINHLTNIIKKRRKDENNNKTD